MTTKKERLIRYFCGAAQAGLSYTDADHLRRDAVRLQTISEQECNGTLYRCEGPMQDHRGRTMAIDAVYQVTNINGPGPLHYYRTADRETGCRRRIDALAAKIGAKVEYQGDPRGCPVMLRLADGRDLYPPVF
jgi:hypothetical protein